MAQNIVDYKNKVFIVTLVIICLCTIGLAFSLLTPSKVPTKDQLPVDKSIDKWEMNDLKNITANVMGKLISVSSVLVSVKWSLALLFTMIIAIWIMISKSIDSLIKVISEQQKIIEELQKKQ